MTMYLLPVFGGSSSGENSDGDEPATAGDAAVRSRSSTVQRLGENAVASGGSRVSFASFARTKK